MDIIGFSCRFTALIVITICGCAQSLPSSEQASGLESTVGLDSSTEASAADLPSQLTVNIGDILFRRIPAGEFVVGAVPGDEVSRFTEGEYPAHRVTLSREFYLSQHEITRGQFQQFVASTGYITAAERSGAGANSLNLDTGEVQQLPQTTWRSPGFPQTDEHPVICVDWYDAVAFCEWLTATHQRTFRLPTEAEWEYACRAGSNTRYHTGDSPSTLQGHANVGDQSLLAQFALARGTAPWFDGAAYTSAVGRFRPNRFGLCDMHGNVGEWCQDWYSKDFYKQSPMNDPTGPDTPTKWHSVRGGSWYNAAFSCRSSGRHDAIETAASTTNGFRVLMER